MLNLVPGRPGSGKSRYIAEKLSLGLFSGREAVVLVPDQNAVVTEDLIAATVDDKYKLNVDVLSFRRLANRVFREHGGLCYNYIGRGGKLLLMWRTIDSLSGSLEHYRGIGISDCAAISLMLDSVTELQRWAVTPSALEKTAQGIRAEENPVLKAKLNDLSLIYAGYSSLLCKSYDDAEEDLTRLCLVLDKNDFFSDKDVYIDSFNSFSGQEYEVLRRILRDCPQVTMTIGRLPDDNREQMSKLEALEETVLKIAREENVPVVREAILSASRSRSRPVFDFLERNIWGSGEKYEGVPEGISLLACNDPLEECEAAAVQILKNVQAGGKWRDNTITMRNYSDYAGIIDAVLAEHGIPFYASKRTDIKSKAAVRLALFALEIKRGNWRADDIIAYMKTGLCNLNPNQICDLERYIRTWNIEGRRRYEDSDWTMNPGGYSDSVDESDLEFLKRVNLLRKELILPLIKFCDSIDKNSTVHSISEELYNFMRALDVPAKLEKTASNADENGRKAEAQELLQVWDAFCTCLDELVSAAGELPCTVAMYKELLTALLNEKNIGSIPTTIDEVLICDAYNLRSNGVKNLFVLGVNDGVFPSAVSENGLFGDRELALLAENGLELPGNTDNLASDELYIFYSAVTSPTENLTISFYNHNMNGEQARPSQAVDAVKSLFPILETTLYTKLRIEDKLYGKKACLPLAFGFGDAAQALREIYTEDETLSGRLSAAERPVSIKEDSLSQQTAGKQYGNMLYLTQSRLDSFVMCPLAYNCKYVLKLSEEKTARLQASDAGTIMHYILEQALRSMKNEGRIKSGISPDEADTLTDNIIASYRKAVCGGFDTENIRMEQLFRRMKKAAKLLLTDLCEEFAQSEFVPAAFELPIGGAPSEDGLTLPPVKLNLPDGGSAVLGGIVDRVDVYKKDHDIYVRIVDYKTGDKTFSIDDIKIGLNTQMLLYIMALCAESGTDFAKAAGCSEGERLLPAGVLYYMARLPGVDAKEGEDAFGTALSEIKRSGLLINDPEVLRAMEHNLSGRFIPVRQGASGQLRSSPSALGAEEFNDLISQLCNTVITIAQNIKSGCSDASPLKNKKHDGCEYCSMRPVCRREESLSGEDNTDSE